MNYCCNSCRKTFPEDQTTLTSEGLVCLSCANRIRNKIEAGFELEERRTALAKTEAENDRRAALRAVKAISIPDPDILASEVVERLGGVEGLASLYVAQVMEAAQRNPGSRTVLQGLKWVTEMVEKIAERQIKRSRLSGMSDEDLEALVVEMMAKQESQLEQTQAEPKQLIQERPAGDR